MHSSHVQSTVLPFFLSNHFRAGLHTPGLGLPMVSISGARTSRLLPGKIFSSAVRRSRPQVNSPSSAWSNLFCFISSSCHSRLCPASLLEVPRVHGRTSQHSQPRGKCLVPVCNRNLQHLSTPVLGLSPVSRFSRTAPLPQGA